MKEAASVAPRPRGALRLFLAYSAFADAERAMRTAAAAESALGRRVADLADVAPTADRVDLLLVADDRQFDVVEPTLAAGTEVWLALELRQIPHLAELATGIAGQSTRRLVPTALLAAATTVELVDVLPGERAGPAPGAQALPRPALFALRELAMRYLASRTTTDPATIAVPSTTRDPAASPGGTAPPARVATFGGAALLLALATGVAAIFDRAGLDPASLVLVYLLGVTAAAAWCGRAPSVVTAVASVLCFNFLFTEPRYTLAVEDPNSLFTLGVLLVIGLLVSSLTARLRDRTLLAQQRGLRAEQLAVLGQELTGSTGTLQIVAAAEHRLRGLLGLDAAILLPGPADARRLAATALRWPDPDGRILQAAQRALDDGIVTGAGCERDADLPAILLPLLAPARTLGVLAVRADANPADADRRRLFEAFAAQIALALQRDLLTEQVHRTLAEAEHERLRSAVLSSVSHDFRTPLAVIAGTAGSMLDAPGLPRATHDEMLTSIQGEAERLSRLVDNLLQMTRIESGRLEPAREWHVVEDLVGSAMTRVAHLVGDRPVHFAIDERLPMVRVDGVLVELVLVNVLENAVLYSPPGSPIDVSARVADGRLQIAIADRGPGLGEEERARVFEKFYRGPGRRSDGSRGSGLGLAICAAIAALHGGTMLAENRADGGARFTLALQVESQPPDLEDTLPERHPPAADA